MENGTPEATVFSAVPPEGITLAALKARLERPLECVAVVVEDIPDLCRVLRTGSERDSALVDAKHDIWIGSCQAAVGAEAADVGFKQAMVAKALKLEKGAEPRVLRTVRARRHTAG